MKHKTSENYFSIELSVAGIGDMLSQYKRLYNLGISLGLHYAHRKFPKTFHCPDLNLDDLLGMSINETLFEDLIGLEVIEIDAFELICWLESGKILEEFLKKTGYKSNYILQIKWNGNLYFYKNKLNLKDNIDLTKKFNLRWNDKITKNSAITKTLNIGIHIRRGDCSWIKIGKKYFFTSVPFVTDDPNHINVKRAPALNVYMDQFNKVLRILKENKAFEDIKIECKIYSDGIPEKFWIFSKVKYLFLFLCLQIIPSKFLNSRFKSKKIKLSELFKVMHNFKIFKKEITQWANLTNISLIEGKSPEQTIDTIRFFATADIAIVGRPMGAFPLIGLNLKKQAIIIPSMNNDEIEHLLLKTFT